VTTEATGATLSPQEAGRRVLARAAIAGLFGGLLIAVVSQSFVGIGAGSMTTQGGLAIGMLIVVASGLPLLAPTSGKVVPGAIVALLAVASVPVSLGGLLLGSLASLYAGAILVAFDPPRGPVRVETVRARYTQRMAALAVDGVAALVVQQVFYRLTGPDVAGRVDVATAWLLAWVLVFLAPSLATTRTLGRLVADTRLQAVGGDRHDPDRPTLLAVSIREILRGVLAIGGVISVIELVVDGFTAPVALAFTAATVGSIGLLVGHERVDAYVGAEAVHDDLVRIDAPVGITAAVGVGGVAR
jgi:hypothetical protein